MKRSRGIHVLRTIGLTGCMLLIGWLSPGLGTAAVQKVDVCHRNDTGGFHLITVAAQAVQAHRAHGDALPGELVPGNPGFKFDASCAEVAASTCPCTFSLAGLASVGLDGSDALAACVLVNEPQAVTITDAGSGGTGFDIAYTNSNAKGCLLQDARNDTVVQRVSPLTSSQGTDCADDLRDAIGLLTIPSCGD